MTKPICVALEIGHGKTGTTAQLVGMAFEQTIGVDLLKHSQAEIEVVIKATKRA